MEHIREAILRYKGFCFCVDSDIFTSFVNRITFCWK